MGQSASVIVDILPGDAGISSAGCGRWSQDLTPVTKALDTPFADGTYLVGIDIAPGAWSSTDSATTCYWSRLGGFSGELRDIVANGLSDGATVVTIIPTDVGFKTSGCGEWKHR